MHILVTNDDGVHAPGLLALAQAVRHFGDVSIIAPERNWSISGHVKTLSRPLRVHEVELLHGMPAYACDGAPADCVALGIMGFLDKPIDMVVSGFNPAPNLGHDVTYSGTVTNAIEAAIWELPGIAFSLDAAGTAANNIDFSLAQDVVRCVVEQVLQHGLPKFTFLSVNIPYLSKEKLKGMRITRQGHRIYRDVLVTRKDPQNHPYYWIGGDPPTGVPEPGTDIAAIEDGYISITPLQLDMTAHSFLESLQGWDWHSIDKMVS